MKNLKAISFVLICCMTLFACKKRVAQPDNSLGLHVIEGKYLSDKCGNKIVLRGINMGSIYAVNFGLTEIDEISKSGANSVRIVLEQQYRDWTNGGKTTSLTAEKIAPVITACINKGMVPILELHDFTGSANIGADLPKAAQWWVSDGIKALLLNYQQSIIINVANEPDNGSASDALYKQANVGAINTLRNAGYTCPIMIDAPNYGKDYTAFVNQGKVILESDPLQNIIFSVHAYWPTVGIYGNYSDAKIKESITALKQTGLPIVLGELAIADVQNGQAQAINFKLLMAQCQANEFGYLAWWWGFSNNAGANNQLSMTDNGLYSGLQGGGKIIAFDDGNSIKKTSKRICQ